jgi:hypothetical protein
VILNLNKPSQFAELFLSKFLENGFGALSKRELEIYVMHFLLADGQFVNAQGKMDFYEMSPALGMTEANDRI